VHQLHGCGGFCAYLRQACGTMQDCSSYGGLGAAMDESGAAHRDVT
jgi:hypothetical protein